MSQPSAGGSHLILSSLLALLSYVPFEFVAKGALIMAALLFVTDPIPPHGRIVSLVSMVVIGLLSQLRKKHIELYDIDNGVTMEVSETTGILEDDENKKDS